MKFHLYADCNSFCASNTSVHHHHHHHHLLSLHCIILSCFSQSCLLCLFYISPSVAIRQAFHLIGFFNLFSKKSCSNIQIQQPTTQIASFKHTHISESDIYLRIWYVCFKIYICTILCCSEFRAIRYDNFPGKAYVDIFLWKRCSKWTHVEMNTKLIKGISNANLVYFASNILFLMRTILQFTI